MPRAWITNASTHVEAMVNSFTAACDQGFVPTTVRLLESPGVDRPVDQAVREFDAVVTAYGGDSPEIRRTTLEEELAVERIQTHHKTAIEAATDRGDEVAVDITPGRKFMSAIAFATGMRYGADHVFYFYLEASADRGLRYPELPRTAARLVDFTEAS